MSPRDPAPSDIELLTRLRQHDDRALATLAETYAEPMGAVAYAILGRRDLVQDAVQDVFITLWTHRTTLDIHDTVRGYLLRAVRNRALDLLRHEHAQHRVADTATDPTFLSRSTTNTAEHTLEADDVDARLTRALASVPPGPRRVFLLSYQSGLSYAEIADALSLTVGSVRTLMYRATQRLAQVLEHPLDP